MQKLKLITPKQAAEMLGFSKGQVITLMKKGKLQHCKLLGKYYTTETAVDSLIDNLMKMQVV